MQASSEEFAQQLSVFYSSAGPALVSIAQLTIHLSLSTSVEKESEAGLHANTAMLLPLAAVCPHLQRLIIHRRIGSNLLQQFGSSCPRLVSLDVRPTELSTSTLACLPSLFPHMTALTALSEREHATSSHGKGNGEVEAVCAALKGCPDLHTFNAGLCAVTQEVWRALPPALHSLTFLPQHDITQRGWERHTGLRKLDLCGNDSSVGRLSSLLAIAPNLDACHLLEVATIDAGFSLWDSQDLTSLDTRLSAGLALTGTHTHWDHVAGKSSTWHSKVALCFTARSDWFTYDWPDPDGLEDQLMPSFMATTMQRLVNFTEVTFANKNRTTQAGDLSHLPRLLPNITTLTVINMSLQASDMHALVSCEKLERLVLKMVGGVDGQALQALCANSRSLRTIDVYGCRDVSVEEEAMFREAGQQLSQVAVVVERGPEVEQEDKERKAYMARLEGNERQCL